MNVRNIFFLLLIAIAVGGAFWSANREADPSQPQNQTVEKKAPNFSLATLDGKRIELYRNDGKPTLIHFWASWCTPCKEEMPQVEKAYEQYGHQANFMIINLTAVDDENKAKQFIKDGGYRFPILFDRNGDVSQMYQVNSIPATFLVDRNGRMIKQVMGAMSADQWKEMMGQIASQGGKPWAAIPWWLAFAAGLLSFLSPCVLPVYPFYLSYITGISVGQLKGKALAWNRRKTIMAHTLFFILGFSAIFYALGFSFSWLGQWFEAYKDLLRMLGAVFIFTMGLVMLEIFQPSFLMREKRFHVSNRRFGYLGSALAGVAFAAGWTPCIGPILSSVLALTAVYPRAGLAYITAYNIGFAIPFFVMAFFLGYIPWIYKYSTTLMKAGGVLMVFMGILLYLSPMAQIIHWFTLWGE